MKLNFLHYDKLQYYFLIIIIVDCATECHKIQRAAISNQSNFLILLIKYMHIKDRPLSIKNDKNINLGVRKRYVSRWDNWLSSSNQIFLSELSRLPFYLKMGPFSFYQIWTNCTFVPFCYHCFNWHAVS